MKKIILLLCIAFMGIACESQPNTVEDKLYACLMESLSQEEKEKIAAIMTEYEQYLIDEGTLASSSAESYWNVYKAFAKNPVLGSQNNFNLEKKISFLNDKNPEELQGLMDCHYKIFETEEYKQSRTYQVKKAMESLEIKDRINPKMIANKVIEHMTPKDFEVAYNRFNTLLFIARYTITIK